MKYRVASAAWIALLGMAACGSDDLRVGGRVHGMWSGVNGVVLRLQAEGVDTLLLVPENGDFQFDVSLSPGSAYIVEVAGTPEMHACAIDAGVTGQVAHDDVTSVSVACRGPAVTVTVPASPGWVFDPTEEDQTVEVSSVPHVIEVTVDGAQLTGAKVGSEPVALGVTAPPIEMPSSLLTVAVDVTAPGGLSKSYRLLLERSRNPELLVSGKAPNLAINARVGQAIALDGDTLLVGAPGESSAMTVDGTPIPGGAPDSGAVYVYVRRAGVWSLQAFLKPMNTRANQRFGTSVAIFEDTLVVGAPGEASAATGVNHDQLDVSAPGAGAAYVFVRTGASWMQQAYLKASNTEADDAFGTSVAITSLRVAVGAPGEDSGAVAGQGDNGADRAGAVYTFVHAGSWSPDRYLKAPSPRAASRFGAAIATHDRSADLVVGAPGESSGSREVDGDQTDQSAPEAGAAYVFRMFDGTLLGYLKASNAAASQGFGSSVAHEEIGIAVGAPGEASSATGVDGDASDIRSPGAGAVYIFGLNGIQRPDGGFELKYAQRAYLKSTQTRAGDAFGTSVALSRGALAVGAAGEANGPHPEAGGAYVFRANRSRSKWSADPEHGHAAGVLAAARFGSSVALSDDALAIGAPLESSPPGAANATLSGAFYIFR